MFASRTLTEHVARGVVGISALVGAVMLAPLGMLETSAAAVGSLWTRGSGGQ